MRSRARPRQLLNLSTLFSTSAITNRARKIANNVCFVASVLPVYALPLTLGVAQLWLYKLSDGSCSASLSEHDPCSFKDRTLTGRKVAIVPINCEPHIPEPENSLIRIQEPMAYIGLWHIRRSGLYKQQISMPYTGVDTRSVGHNENSTNLFSLHPSQADTLPAHIVAWKSHLQPRCLQHSVSP